MENYKFGVSKNSIAASMYIIRGNNNKKGKGAMAEGGMP
jgi:hypothetical protein